MNNHEEEPEDHCLECHHCVSIYTIQSYGTEVEMKCTKEREEFNNHGKDCEFRYATYKGE